MIELEEEELKAIVHEGYAEMLDKISEEFDEAATYKGSDLKNWLGSFANQHRKEALRIILDG